MDRRGGRNLPRSVEGTMRRFGWTTKDVAARFGVSDRTARRWRQQDRIPDKKRDSWNDAKKAEARARQRAKMEKGGIKKLTVTGTYRISKTRGKANSSAPIQFMGNNKISGAQMQEVFGALDRGDREAADDALNQALAEAYEAEGLHVEDAEGLSFDY
jgi:DNA-binding transcriptional MerR regulator